MNAYMMEPLEINAAVPCGDYEVTVSVMAHSDTVLSIFAQNRSFYVRDFKLCRREEKDITFTVNVCSDIFGTNGIKIQLVCDGDLTATAAVTPVTAPVLYICGGSGTAAYPSQYPYDPYAARCGWGQALPQFTKGVLSAANRSLPGSCIAEFIQTRLAGLRDEIQPGSFAVISFGDDEHMSESDALDRFGRDMDTVIKAVTEKGAVPIVCSPINAASDEYVNAAEASARRNGAVFIDLRHIFTGHTDKLGADGAQPYILCGSAEHGSLRLNDAGGTLAARLFAREILSRKIPLSRYMDEAALCI